MPLGISESIDFTSFPKQKSQDTSSNRVLELKAFMEKYILTHRTWDYQPISSSFFQIYSKYFALILKAEITRFPLEKQIWNLFVQRWNKRHKPYRVYFNPTNWMEPVTQKTSMHSSRLCTARLLTVSWGGGGGGSAFWGRSGVCLWVCLSSE